MKKFEKAAIRAEANKMIEKDLKEKHDHQQAILERKKEMQAAQK